MAKRKKKEDAPPPGAPAYMTTYGDMMTLFKIRRGRYSVVEEKVPSGAKVIGKQLKELDLAEHCVIAAIIRDGTMTLPRGDSVLQEDDASS